ncbi:MAG: hypothetical protein ACRENW_06690 [Thermodesulfobacteriota bacterium]
MYDLEEIELELDEHNKQLERWEYTYNYIRPYKYEHLTNGNGIRGGKQEVSKIKSKKRILVFLLPSLVMCLVMGLVLVFTALSRHLGEYLAAVGLRSALDVVMLMTVVLIVVMAA